MCVLCFIISSPYHTNRYFIPFQVSSENECPRSDALWECCSQCDSCFTEIYSCHTKYMQRQRNRFHSINARPSSTDDGFTSFQQWIPLLSPYTFVVFSFDFRIFRIWCELFVRKTCPKDVARHAICNNVLNVSFSNLLIREQTRDTKRKGKLEGTERNWKQQLNKIRRTQNILLEGIYKTECKLYLYEQDRVRK